MKYISYSDIETKQIAENFARNLKSNIIALTGELGAGKTTFTQGFAKGLGINDKIISPTFVLVRQHKIPTPVGRAYYSGIFYHIDLYRLENIKDLKQLGLEEFWSNPENIVLIEWAEKIKASLPKNTIWISFKSMSSNQREIISE